MEQLKRLSSHEYDKMIQDVTHILPMPFLQKRDDDDDDDDEEAEVVGTSLKEQAHMHCVMHPHQSFPQSINP